MYTAMYGMHSVLDIQEAHHEQRVQSCAVAATTWVTLTLAVQVLLHTLRVE